MRPYEWNSALRSSVPVLNAYNVVAREARAFLIANRHAGPYSTDEVVEALYPIRFARTSTEAMWARERIAKALTKRALGTYALADCMSEGPPIALMGKGAYNRLPQWHAPREA